MLFHSLDTLGKCSIAYFVMYDLFMRNCCVFSKAVSFFWLKGMQTKPQQQRSEHDSWDLKSPVWCSGLHRLKTRLLSSEAQVHELTLLSCQLWTPKAGLFLGLLAGPQLGQVPLMEAGNLRG